MFTKWFTLDRKFREGKKQPLLKSYIYFSYWIMDYIVILGREHSSLLRTKLKNP